jgi:N-acetylglucosaminyl-diphospho-decaprenol L-rhamnosyltransferase
MTISVSIVSHGQGGHVEALLADIERLCAGPLEILVTLNVHESFEPKSQRFTLSTTVNPLPQGFGANHNAAFSRARGEYFCVLNPDLRLEHDPFPELLRCLADERVGLCAPLVRDPAGRIEDSARHFPTPAFILAKVLGLAEGRFAYAVDAERAHPDWVAGMFMLCRSELYRSLGGFDERYHLYYEDVDLCARLRLAGYEVALCPGVCAVHDARRESRRSARYFAWHARSMARWFASRPYRAISARRKAAHP